MKQSVTFFFFYLMFATHAQQTELKSFEINADVIEINTKGLDEIVLENSNDNQVTIFLSDENSFNHVISSSDEGSLLKINFQTEVKNKEGVFRKFITERLNRAIAKIKIPKHKKVTFLGDEIDIISKNYNGNLSIYIEKGDLKLGEVNQTVTVKMYSGNISATVKNQNLTIKTTSGRIRVDGKLYQSLFNKVSEKSTQNFTVNSIKANVVLNIQKTQ